MNSPIQVEKQDAGIYRVTYFGKEAGWIHRGRMTRDNDLCYRALTVHGEIKHFRNLELAKCFIISHYH